MPIYAYKAIMPNGLIVKNKIEELNRKNVINKLKNNDLVPIEIVRVANIKKKQRVKKKNISSMDEAFKSLNTSNLLTNKMESGTGVIEKINMKLASSARITVRDIVIFTQNFYLLKKANFNNIHALSTIIESTENYSFRGILEDILAGVEAGENMYTTMEYYSDVFPYIYINMIKVGELSGSLTNSLSQAVKYLDDTEKIRKKLRNILIPNLIQFVLLLVLLIVGTLVAIPAIQNVFDAVGTKDKLPAITIWFSKVVDKLVAVIVAYIRTPKGKYNYHYFKYTAPIFGKLIFSIDFSRLMRAMLLNLKNGMRVQEALEVSKNVVQNYVMLSIVESAINNILIGGSWIESFEKSNLASPMTVEMLKIGMQTDLVEMMEKLLEYMDIDINNTLYKIMKVLPQIVYIIVGLVLIFFVLVVLVPCVQLYMGNFLFSAYGY